MNRIMSIAAFAISVVALCLAVHSHFHADRMAEQALRRREQQMIDRMWPNVKAIYDDLLQGSKGYTGEKPETIEELFTPLVTMVEQVGG
jgi:hypothetical protein